MKSNAATIKEYEELPDNMQEELELNKKELSELLKSSNKQGPILQYKNGKLKAQNYVGVITTRKGTVLEILPKGNLYK